MTPDLPSVAWAGILLGYVVAAAIHVTGLQQHDRPARRATLYWALGFVALATVPVALIAYSCARGECF